MICINVHKKTKSNIKLLQTQSCQVMKLRQLHKDTSVYIQLKSSTALSSAVYMHTHTYIHVCIHVHTSCFVQYPKWKKQNKWIIYDQTTQREKEKCVCIKRMSTVLTPNPCLCWPCSYSCVFILTSNGVYYNSLVCLHIVN